VLAACGLIACAGDSHDPAGPAHDASAHAYDDDFQGCPDGIPSVAPGLHGAGEQLAVSVVAAMPEEPERYINQWTVELERLDGAPDPDAVIVRGETFMPIHGHDGRLQPEAGALPLPGRFEVDRLNFTMRGPWEVRLWLRSGAGDDDYVVIDVCVAR
jgi:hypothetical protein